MDNIIVKYLAGEASPGEVKAVEHWKKQNPVEFEKWVKAYRTDIFEEVAFDIPEIRIPRKSPRKLYYAIAAGFILLLGLSMFFHQTKESVDENMISFVNTGKSGLKYVLPDGTYITLNTGAKISYPAAFQRHLNLEGTAFLSVRKDPSHPFVVNTELSTIRVLGTQFLIQKLSHGQNIILKEGTVEVNYNHKGQKVLRDYGDALRIDEKGDFASFGKANCKLYLSWTSSKIDFNHCTVEEVLQYLGDTYNIRYQIQDSALLETRLAGSAPAHNPDLVIRAIAAITKKKVKTLNHRFIFE